MSWRHVLVSWLLAPLLLALFALRPKLRAGWWQRLYWGARPPLAPRASERRLRVWAHGASAGDVLAVQPLLDALAAVQPLELTVTALTDTGVAMARQRCQGAQVRYLPHDLPGATRRALRAIGPELLLLERGELWPALIRQAHRAGVLVVVVNARIGDATVRGVRALSLIAGRFVDDVDLWLARDDDAAARVRGLGVAAARVHVTGNTKLDAAVRIPDPAAVRALGQLLGVTAGDPLIVAGSTHQGEEAIVVDAFAAIRAQVPRARLLIAPRYLQRGDEVQALVEQRGLVVARRSQGGEALRGAPVLLLDTLGELTAAYGLARAAFVGGSLVPRGGQNLLEPAAQGVPVLCGPHTEHARDQLALLRGSGLVEVHDVDALAAALGRLLVDPAHAAEQGGRARAAAQRGTGAVQRCLQVLRPALAAQAHRRP